MVNPFDWQLVPEGYDLELLGRSEDFLDLDMKCANSESLSFQYISPRGTGKTTLMKTFFSPERRKEFAQNYKKLVGFLRITGDEIPKEADVIYRLIEAVRDAFENLDPDSTAYKAFVRELERLETEQPQFAADSIQGERVLRDILTYLKSKRYRILLILDEFHQWACAKNLADSTFSKIAAIAQKEDTLISYIVVSDYDDKVGTKNFYMSSFTRIFSGITTHLMGVTSKRGKKGFVELIRQKLERFPDVEFTDEELDVLLDATGGIPGLMQAALRDLYEMKRTDPEEFTPEEIRKYALAACTPLMKKWVQYFDDVYWENMETALECVKEDIIKSRISREKDKIGELCNAGLLVKNLRRQEYHAICPLFEEYIRQELSRRGEQNIALPGGLHIDNLVVSPGGRLVLGEDHSSTVMAQNAVVQQGLTASAVLELLRDAQSDSRELFASRLAEQLRKNIAAGSFKRLSQSEFATEEEYEESYDRQFHAYSQSVVQDVEVDENDRPKLTDGDKQTLEKRFADARTRCRSELTDEILSGQSERCQFYVKLSVIVEDALNIPGIQMDDYSPQLVLYGKALEQSLRDNFFNLFHRETHLSTFDTYRHETNAGSPNTFGEMEARDTYIGNYRHMMYDNKNYLASLCSSHQIQVQNQPANVTAWTGWWNKMQSDTNFARKIRNKADHADADSPTQNDLNQMCGFLFGNSASEGVLSRAVIGKRLYEKLFPEEQEVQIPQQNVSWIPIEIQNRYLQKVCDVKCLEVKTNGALRCVLCNGGYVVKISKKSAQAYRASHSFGNGTFAGMNLAVKITECRNQDNETFFVGTIESVSS